MTKHEFETIVRTQVTMTSGAGPAAGAAITKILAAAEEYRDGNSRGAIAYRKEGTGEVVALDVRELKARFKGIREPLLAALPRGGSR